MRCPEAFGVQPRARTTLSPGRRPNNSSAAGQLITSASGATMDERRTPQLRVFAPRSSVLQPPCSPVTELAEPESTKAGTVSCDAAAKPVRKLLGGRLR